MHEPFSTFVVFVWIFGRLTITNEPEDNFVYKIVSHVTTNVNMVVVSPGYSTNWAVWRAHIPMNLGALLELQHRAYIIMSLRTVTLTRALLYKKSAYVIFSYSSGPEKGLEVPTSSSVGWGWAVMP
jgi:hypothetical protein